MKKVTLELLVDENGDEDINPIKGDICDRLERCYHNIKLVSYEEESMTMCLWLARPLIHRPVVPALVVTVIKRQAVQRARKLKNKFMTSREMKIVSEVMNDE